MGATLAWIGATALIAVLSHHHWAIAPAAWMAWPMTLVLLNGRQGVWGHGMPRPAGRSALELLGCGAAVVAIAAWVATWSPAAPLTLGLALLHVLWIVPAEEWFFRGELQGRLRTLMGSRWAVALTAAAFALSHLAITRTPLALTVVLPGLLFGGLRERQGALLGPILVHTAANLSLAAWCTWA